MFNIYYFALVFLSATLYLCIPSQTEPVASPKYVSYLTHSGLNNQRIALENAILTAYLLNRTLIIPPLFLGRAVPWKPFNHLRSLLKQRIKQIETTRRKCIDEVSHRISLNNATLIRENLYISCRKPSREVTKWSNFVDFKFLSKLNISFVEMDTLHYPNFNISDTTIIKDDELYSYKLFDTDLDQIHHHQFEYFDVTTFENNEYVHKQPVIDTPIPMNNELQSEYMAKYKIPLEISFLRKFNHSLLQFGSLFGSSRLALFNKENIKLQRHIQNSLIFDNDFINKITLKMKSEIGPFLAIHYRSTEAGFINHRQYFMKHLHKELRTYMSFYIQQKHHELPGLLFADSPISSKTLLDASKSNEYEFKNDELEAIVRENIPTLAEIANIDNVPDKMQKCKKFQKTWLKELIKTHYKDNRDKDARIYDKQLLKDLPAQLPLVLYIATDVVEPRKDKFLRNIQTKYPCTFYLQDFRDADVLRSDPLMMQEINIKLKQSAPPIENGDLLAFGKGNLYYAFIDQIMAGSGVAFYGTEGSTFSQMSSHVYLKDCENEFYYPLDLIKGYTNQQIWIKNRRRVLQKLVIYATEQGRKVDLNKLESWLKFMPLEYQLKLIWEYIGCGYMKML